MSKYVIALTPFKNEEWILPSYLSTTKLIADKIIAIDDGSTDSSRRIMENAGVEVHDNDKPVDIAWNEHHIREKLLQLGRQAGGTHFICLDADEALTTNFVRFRDKILDDLEPGEKVRLQWLAMWKSAKHFREDHSVWSNNYKDFMFRDDGEMSYPYKWLHVGRTPGDDEQYPQKVLKPKFGAAMHFQFSDWKNFQTKQCYLRCSELIKKPGMEEAINNQYKPTLDDPNAVVRAVPDQWIKRVKLPDLDKDWTTWRYQGMLDYFDQYGIEYFEGLEIWHCKELYDEFVNRTGRNPKGY